MQAATPPGGAQPASGAANTAASTSSAPSATTSGTAEQQKQMLLLQQRQFRKQKLQQQQFLLSTMSTNPSDCLRVLVEEHMTSVIRDAASVQRHAKRARLHPKPNPVTPSATPTTAATATATTGASTNGTNNNGAFWTRSRLHAADLNLALQLRGAEPLYGTHATAHTTSWHNSHTNPDDVIIDLNDFVRQSSTAVTRPPSEIAASMHWLAVQGVVPEIPQNQVTSSTTTSAIKTAAAAARPSNSHNPLLVQQLQTAVLSEELQLYFARVTMALESSVRKSSSHSTLKRNRPDSNVRAVLQSLATDAGLQELVPFLIRYSQQALYQHVEHSLAVLQLILALLENPHLHLELYIHEILPALMTCIVTTTTTTTASTTSPSGTTPTLSRRKQKELEQQHWAIRQWASLALVTACRLFQNEYVTLQARVLRTLCQALDPTKPLQSRYGGLVALSQFGPKAVDAFGVDMILHSWPRWQALSLQPPPNRQGSNEETDVPMAGNDIGSTTKNSTTPNNDMLREKWQEQQHAIVMCQQAALEALHVYFQGVTLEEQANRRCSGRASEGMDWYEVLGDAVTPLVVMAEENQIAYATAFV